MMPTFLILPDADVTAGVPTTLTNALIDADTTLGGLANGTAYRAFVLSEQSDAFTPAAVSRSIALQTTQIYDGASINVHTFTTGWTAATGETIVLGVSSRRGSGSDGVASITIGGQVMTAVAVGTGTLLGFLAIRKLTAPILATDEIVITYTATGLHSLVRIIPWKCVGYGDAFHASNLATLTSTSVSTTADVPADGAAFVVQTNAGPTATDDLASITGATKQVDLALGASRRTVAGSVAELAVETGRTFTVTGPESVSRRIGVATLGVA